MKHTPGPWKVRKDYGRHWISAGKGKREILIADIIDVETGVGSGETETNLQQIVANARLIAAAPELLQACQELVRVGEPEYGIAVGILAKAKDAITKATGQKIIHT